MPKTTSSLNWNYYYSPSYDRIYLRLTTGEWQPKAIIPTQSRKKKYQNTGTPIKHVPADKVPATVTIMPNFDTRLDTIGTQIQQVPIVMQDEGRLPPCPNITDDLRANLSALEPTRSWATAMTCVTGNQNDIFHALHQGTLQAVTDGSDDDPRGTAAIHIEANPSTVIQTVLITPATDQGMQSHRAKLSGHYAIITILEVLEQMQQTRDTNP